MIKQLRRKHLLIWSIWAILIPLGIISAWMVIPAKATDNLLQPEKGMALPELIRSIEKKNFTANLKSNEDRSAFQLEWINKEISVLPSSLIYKVNHTENELIGRIERKGIYYFSLAKDSTSEYRFILYDIIRKQIIDSLNFGQ
jgi:hypothetical protein